MAPCRPSLPKELGEKWTDCHGSALFPFASGEQPWHQGLNVATVLIRSLPGGMAPTMARHSDGSEQVFDRKENHVCVKGDDVVGHDYDRQGENLLPLVSNTAFIQSDGGDLLFHVDRDA